MKRTILCLTLLGTSPALADEPFSPAARKVMNECLAAHSQIDGAERYAFVEAGDGTEDSWYKIPDGEDGWSSAHGETLEQLEFNFSGETLVSLRNTSATEHVYSQTDICFYGTGEPAVSVLSESYSFDWICDASGKQVLSDEYVTLEKLTQLSTSGLFSVETRLYTHAQEMPKERFCGPAAVLHELHQPGLYLLPVDQILNGAVADMRKNAPEL